jgi:hypothetical protein
MTRDWKPVPAHPDEIEALLAGFAAVVEGRSAIYVSSPLTTGLRAFRWHTSYGLASASGQQSTSTDFRRDVVEPNRAEAAAYVRNVRRTLNKVVIDPTAMPDIPDWAQADYHTLWAGVIERYVESVIFRDGWMYSNGCAYEFFVGHSTGARLLTEELKALSLDQGRELLRESIQESRKRNAPPGILADIVAALSETAGAELSQ